LTSQSGVLSILGVSVGGVVAVSWNSCVVLCCINEDGFDVVVVKAEQLLLIAVRKREIARVLLVFMIDY